MIFDYHAVEVASDDPGVFHVSGFLRPDIGNRRACSIAVIRLGSQSAKKLGRRDDVRVSVLHDR
jgi:hypothetical protein